jgi:hypothetical protein
LGQNHMVGLLGDSPPLVGRASWDKSPQVGPEPF